MLLSLSLFIFDTKLFSTSSSNTYLDFFLIGSFSFNSKKYRNSSSFIIKIISLDNYALRKKKPTPNNKHRRLIQLIARRRSIEDWNRLYIPLICTLNITKKAQKMLYQLMQISLIGLKWTSLSLLTHHQNF